MKNPETVVFKTAEELHAAQAHWAAKLEEPELIETVCAHIANGGGIFDLCSTWNIPRNWLVNWLRKDKVRHDAYMAACFHQSDWLVERIIVELKRLSTFDVRQLFNDDQTLKPMSEWPDGAAAAVEAVDVDEIWEGSGEERAQVGVTKRIKVSAKTKALQLLGKQLGMFKERIEISGTVTVADGIKRARERAQRARKS